jgi:hypothetical protein
VNESDYSGEFSLGSLFSSVAKFVVKAVTEISKIPVVAVVVQLLQTTAEPAVKAIVKAVTGKSVASAAGSHAQSTNSSKTLITSTKTSNLPGTIALGLSGSVGAGAFVNGFVGVGIGYNGSIGLVGSLGLGYTTGETAGIDLGVISGNSVGVNSLGGISPFAGGTAKVGAGVGLDYSSGSHWSYQGSLGLGESLSPLGPDEYHAGGSATGVLSIW